MTELQDKDERKALANATYGSEMLLRGLWDSHPDRMRQVGAAGPMPDLRKPKGNWSGWGRSAPVEHGYKAAQAIVEPPKARTSCTYCGVNSEYGCKHNPVES